MRDTELTRAVERMQDQFTDFDSWAATRDIDFEELRLVILRQWNHWKDDGESLLAISVFSFLYGFQVGWELRTGRSLDELQP